MPPCKHPLSTPANIYSYVYIDMDIDHITVEHDLLDILEELKVLEKEIKIWFSVIVKRF